MEIRIAKDQFKHFSLRGKYGNLRATMKGGILSISDYCLTIDSVPFEAIADSPDDTDHMEASIAIQAVKDAGLSIKVSNWLAVENGGDSIPTFKPVRILIDKMKGSLLWLNDATSRDEGRPNLNGIHVEVTDGIVDMVATDGHRLGWDQAINEVESENVSVTIRRDLIATALKIAGKKGDLGVMELRELTERKGAFNLSFTGLPGYLWVRATTELEYPEFRRVVPSGFRMTPKVCYSEFKVFVKLASKIISKNKIPLVYLRFETGFVSVYVRDGNGEKIAENLACDYQGETFEIAYNVRYLLEALDGMTGEPDDKIKFYIKGEASASLLIDRDRKAVIMPVRI